VPLVLGVDSSTQSTKLELRDAATGRLEASARAPHPPVSAPRSEQHPEAWWDALGLAAAGLGRRPVAALAIGGQQHGMVVLDADGSVVRPAKLWNDTESAPDAAVLVERLGAEAWSRAVGLVPVASYTVTKLAWLRRCEPEAWSRVARVVLPHDWLNLRCTGEAATDRGDASGTGYWSPTVGEWRPDLLELIDDDRDWARCLPEVKAPAEPVGPLVGEARDLFGPATVGPGTGDNMAAALGLGLAPGDVAISVGTSGTVYAVSEVPIADPTGTVAGFADATGRFLPLVATLNAARVLTATARLLGTDLAALDQLALSVPDSGGLVLLPYLDGERTPDLPAARGLLHGLTRGNATPAHLARAAVEGMLCGLADGIDALRAQGVEVRRALLIGGGARSAAVQALAPAVLGIPVRLPRPAEYVALGAARQAAWTLAGSAEPPSWPVAGRPLADATPATGLREAYAATLAAADPLLR
jgi:xylulokinase